MAFANVDSKDVLVFGMYVYEYPEQRLVFLPFVDTVPFLPKR